MAIALAYLVTLVAFAAIDAVWLGSMAGRIYRPLIGDILLDGFRVGSAIAFYLFYAAGLVIFAVAPALKGGTVLSAFAFGALFGFFAYATYDLTNFATLRSWGLAITLIDMAWGTFVSGLASALAILACGWLFRVFGLSA